MIMTQEQAFLKAQTQLTNLIAFVRAAPGEGLRLDQPGTSRRRWLAFHQRRVQYVPPAVKCSRMAPFSRTPAVISGSTMLSTPGSLLERLRKPKETTAWDRFVELYSPLLFHWAKRLGQQDADAADLVQEVFLLLWRKLPLFEYDASRSFHAWLKALFLNRARQRLRERVPVTVAQDLHALPDRWTAVADQAEYRHYVLHRALQLVEREFSAQHVAAFRQYVVAGRPVEEVAQALHLRPGTIYCIKSRIQNRLRQELANLLD
jgi:RNA polymerase sigma-70 factor (ECF subfamily)